jgi:hypothetical protein
MRVEYGFLILHRSEREVTDANDRFIPEVDSGKRDGAAQPPTSTAAANTTLERTTNARI